MISESYRNSSTMINVKKRDGSIQEVSGDKIFKRINTQCEKLFLNRINKDFQYKLVKETVNGLFDGVTTEEIDHYIAVICAENIRDEPQFDKLATSLCISRLHKETLDDFFEVTTILKYNTDHEHKTNPLVNEKYFNFVKENKDKIQKEIVYERDYDFDYFGYKTLEKSYLYKILNKYQNTIKENKNAQFVKQVDVDAKDAKDAKSEKKPNAKKEQELRKNIGIIIERPQHMLMRVALALNMDNFEQGLETYKLLSTRYMIFGSPTLFNAGSECQQLSSCFLLYMADSLDKIFELIADVAQISKRAGGIGISLSDIRSNGSLIRGTNGCSDGIIPLIKVLNSVGRYVNQGGRRKGAIAVYIEPWDSEIFEFCELRNNKSSEEMKARDIFLGLWIPDLFMKRVEEDGYWSLMCPDECKGLTSTYGEEFEILYTKYEQEGKYKKRVRAKDLWFHILSTQIETGVPYMLYKDHVNRQSNQKNIGVIRSSNLCVSGDTYILTDKGQIPIKDLVNQKVNIWNGEDWSNVHIRKTGINKKLINVKLSNGVEIKCTPEHKFYIVGGEDNELEIVQANQLKLNDQLIKYNLPIVKLDVINDMKYPYRYGYFCAISIFDNVSYKRNSETEKDMQHWGLMKKKFYVPLNQSLDVTLRWLEGYCDANGTISKVGSNEYLQISSEKKEFLLKVKLMIQVIGINSKVNKNKDKYREGLKEIFILLINSNELYKLYQLGFSPKKLKFKEILSQREVSQFIKVVGIENLEEKEDTYCFNEKKRHMGMFNGILTGQCSEIVEYTSEEEIAVCNLGSICLPMFVESDKTNPGKKLFNFDKLLYVSGVCTNNLNKVIDINYYPVEKAKKSNLKHRPIGVGVQGLADVYCMMDLPYDSDEARILNKKIFETIYFGCLKQSVELAKKYGPYESFYINGGSPFSHGKLQFHLWGCEKDLLMGFNWEGLIEDIKKYGTRNSLLTTVMPTASTSQIMANIESIEPITSNVYTRTTLAGEFVVTNKYLVEKLIQLELWNENIRDELLYDKGSVQNISEIPQYIKEIYKTAFEMKTKPLVQQAIDRGPFIDQSQSLNIFSKVPDFSMLASSHFYTWRNKLKTGMYYLRTQPAVDPMEFGIDAEKIIKIKNKRNIPLVESLENKTEINKQYTEDFVCDVCSG